MMKWIGNNVAGLEWTSVAQKVKLGTAQKISENRFIQMLSASKWMIVLVIMGFLLGRAMILEELTPFALSYFAVMYFLRKDWTPWIAISLVGGSFFSLTPHTGFIITEILVFWLIQLGLDKYERSELAGAPVTVFLTAFMVKLFTYMVSAELTWYALMMSAVEAVLSCVLTLILVQALPVFTLSRKHYQLKHEEIVCLMILLASVMTGTVGWQIGSVTIEHVFSRYLILLFALVGGAPLGASVGVVTGLILSLANVNAIYQMSLLAFSGMLAGILKEGGKMGIALGMLIGSSILSVYVGDQSQILSSTWESIAAVVLFVLTPKGVIQILSKYVPGTQEHMKSQQDYAKRVRDLTASRVEQFSEVFKQLSRSFVQFTTEHSAGDKSGDFDHFMNASSEKVCRTCHRRDQCWGEKFPQTYKYMTEMMLGIEAKGSIAPKDIPDSWRKACVRTEAVHNTMKHQYDLHKNNLHWKKQIQDSRQLVADQLFGVSQVMEDLAKEIKREGQELFLQEEQIRQTLEELGLSIHSIDIVSLDEGNVEIEIIHQYTRGFDECRKIIAPLLSDILGENIAVKSERMHEEGGGYATVLFGSAKEYEVETGVAGAAKGGDILSGDSFSTVELGNGKFAVALSDGMGNGERARAESSSALSILQQLLQSGMDEKLAIKSVNSVLLLRSSDEMYATVDLALIDMYTANTTFMKIGSTPSFIKRGDEVIPISASNLPVGILQEIDVELVSVQLHPGDVLFMMSDGIYDAGPALNKEKWMKRMIKEIHAETPQELADGLLDRIVRYHQGEIKDDMTVVVAKVEKHRPEWATFHWPGFSRIERPRTVS